MNYSNGSIIEYRTWTGEVRRIVVTEKLDDVKNGRSGFDGVLVDDTGFEVWGYDDQIIRVVAR
jgi:hypothetical protein